MTNDCQTSFETLGAADSVNEAVKQGCGGADKQGGGGDGADGDGEEDEDAAVGLVAFFDTVLAFMEIEMGALVA